MRVSPANVTVLALFSFVALVSVYMVKDGIIGKITPRNPRPPIVAVARLPVALSDFPAGHLLSPDDIGKLYLHPQRVPREAIMEPDALVGRRLKVAVMASAAFTGNLLYPPGEGSSAERALKPAAENGPQATAKPAPKPAIASKPATAPKLKPDPRLQQPSAPKPTAGSAPKATPKPAPKATRAPEATRERAEKSKPTPPPKSERKLEPRPSPAPGKARGFSAEIFRGSGRSEVEFEQ